MFGSGTGKKVEPVSLLEANMAVSSCWLGRRIFFLKGRQDSIW